jgi:hypothetical protein
MKKVFFGFILFVGFLSLIYAQNTPIDLERDNPNTLIGKTYLQFKIFNLSVNMTHEQAWFQINKDSRIYGEVDSYNPERIYVYNAENRKAILYLIWDKDEENMSSITVFIDCRSFLSSSFKRLLTFEAVDNASTFKTSFLGFPNRNRITLDVPSINLKYITYYLNSPTKILPTGGSDGTKDRVNVKQPETV